MLQSQIINVLPRRLLAGLWSTHETRISVIIFCNVIIVYILTY